MNKKYLVDFILTELRGIYDENGIDESGLSDQTTLFGGSSEIDSLALVGLVIKLEEFVLEKSGKEIQIIDEDSIINEGKTPFKNADSLADLVLSKLNHNEK